MSNDEQEVIKMSKNCSKILGRRKRGGRGRVEKGVKKEKNKTFSK
jgi:hypothetical protein